MSVKNDGLLSEAGETPGKKFMFPVFYKFFSYFISFLSYSFSFIFF